MFNSPHIVPQSNMLSIKTAFSAHKALQMDIALQYEYSSTVSVWFF